MRDSFGRSIDYLRIAVTDRCNFRCSYCMPPEGVKLFTHSDMLSYEELLRVIKVLGQHGITKIRLTGGEPLVRKGLVDFVRGIKSLEYIEDLAMTTNGSLLENQAFPLKEAGLDRVSISLDTNNPEDFTSITRTGKLEDVLRGIQSAIAAGLSPIKLNVVMTEVLTRETINYFIEETYKLPIIVRFIEYMPISPSSMKPAFDIEGIKAHINNAGHGLLRTADTIKGNGPAKYYRLPNGLGLFGFITPMTEHFCHSCNRIRLTADGKFKPCLLSNQEIDIKKALRTKSSDKEIAELFFTALQTKPLGHTLSNSTSQAVLTRNMSQVGG